MIFRRPPAPEWIAVIAAAVLLAIVCRFCVLSDHAAAVCLLSLPDPQREGDSAGLAALSSAGDALFLAEHGGGNLLSAADGVGRDPFVGRVLAAVS
jgi:hypothetical protein